MRQQTVAAVLAALLALPVAASAAGPAQEAPLDQGETLRLLTRENGELKEKLRVVASAITEEKLAGKSLAGLREVAVDVKAQRQTMAEFEGFVKWMAGNLDGYSRYIKAGSVAAGLAKVLPIPYAGEASAFTKFISQGVISLNSASVAISSYLDTSQRFLTMVDGIETAPDRGKAVADAVRFADGALLRGMDDVRQKLTTASEVSSSALSFMTVLEHYVGNSDEYWNKTKALLSRKEVDKNEKSFLSQSVSGLKGRADSFNGKFRGYEETIARTTPAVKRLVAYDDLLKEIRQPVVAGVLAPGG